MALAFGLAKIIGLAALASPSPKWKLPEFAAQGGAQNPSYFNPQISVSGDFAAVLADNSNEKRHADFREIEIGFAADADPNLRVVGFLSVAKEDDETKLEIEEFFGEYSHLGRGTSAKFGKIAAAIGRVQRNHTDQLEYLDYPLVIRDNLGDEGLRAPGASFSYLFPGRRFSEFTFEYLDIGDEGPVFNGSDLSQPGYVGRYRTFFDFNEDLSAQLGFSYLNGPSKLGVASASRGPASEETKRGDMYGIDYTMKWQPGAKGKSALFEAEAYWSKPGGAEDRTFGIFGRAAYEFKPRWFATVGYDYSEIPGTEDIHKGWLAGLTFKLTEFNHWRLEFQRLDSNFEKDRSLLTLQLQWLIGAHPAHKY